MYLTLWIYLSLLGNKLNKTHAFDLHNFIAFGLFVRSCLANHMVENFKCMLASS